MTARAAIDLSKVILRGQLVNNAGLSGDGVRKAVGNHLQPGVVKYDNDDGSSITYLLPLEAIEAMRPTAAGVPLVGASEDYDHVKVDLGKEYDGKIEDSFWDGESGWERTNFTITNLENIEGIEHGYQLSCAYVPTEVDETPGKWHNIPYDAVIKNGRYTHIAIVPEPRYNGATIELKNSGGLLKKTLKALIASVIPAKELKELANAMELDEKEAAKAKAKGDYEAAMKNAKTDEERAAAKSAYENAMAAADQPGGADDPEKKAREQQLTAERMNKVKALRNAADSIFGIMPEKSKELRDEADKLEKMPLGGGDVSPDPGVVQAQESPADRAARETREKKNADEAADKKAFAEREAKEKAEFEKQEAAEHKNAADAWAHFAPEMLEDEVANLVLVNSGKVIALASQPEKVRSAWRAAVKGAEGADVAAKVASLTAKGVAAIELKNALKEKAEKAAKDEILKTERFNALRKAASERGANGTIPASLAGDSVEDRAALGRQLFGSAA